MQHLLIQNTYTVSKDGRRICKTKSHVLILIPARWADSFDVSGCDTRTIAVLYISSQSLCTLHCVERDKRSDVLFFDISSNFHREKRTFVDRNNEECRYDDDSKIYDGLFTNITIVSSAYLI